MKKDKLIDNSYWNKKQTKWKQPSVKIKHGDLVDVDLKDFIGESFLGRYAGKGYGVVEFHNYATGVKHHIGKVVGRGVDRNPRLISDEELFNRIED